MIVMYELEAVQCVDQLNEVVTFINAQCRGNLIFSSVLPRPGHWVVLATGP